ncbi:MAG: stage II sporulation protein M [Chthoniobacteraceae bacterium]
MIIDLPHFIDTEREFWVELERVLDKLDADPDWRMNLQETQRFHYLYKRVLSDLARIATFSSEPEIRRYLESLTARAYGEMHEARDRALRFTPWRWFSMDFPRAFRRHISFFWLSCAVTLLGIIFGAGMVGADSEAKQVLIPSQFGHLYQTPEERVKHEEEAKKDRLAGEHASFSTSLMANNIRVSILMLGMGVSYGVGTLLLLFYNGVIVGAIALDYMQAGKTAFLLGWLMPHGVIEIPAILIAGQAGLLLGRTLLGRGDRHPLVERLRAARGDLVFLILGVSVMLVWAGLVESFLSQYHQPVISYSSKIAFGSIELCLLAWFLSSAGKKARP